MGCDIHLYTEALQNINDVPTWWNVDNWRLNKYFGQEDEDWAKQYEIASQYHRRDYSLFAVLAGVRDYSDSGNVVIAEPRGLPADVTDVVRAEYDDDAGHTPSWLTLKEIRDYAGNHGAAKESGFIEKEDAAKLDARTLPDEWCQGSSRQDQMVWREWSRPNRGLQELIVVLERHARDVFWIFDETAPVPDETAAKLRTVFWFDN